ncbi:phenylalanine--tRNA ligase subunit beta, partial [bacterium]|nr:phenylalanine--tRNA ligase subunit beta [bacterium]
MRLPLFWLREFVDAPDGVGEVADLLTAIGLACEEELEVGGDAVLELATPSNRTDVLSIYGLAREVAAKTGAPLLGLPLGRLPATQGGAVAVELADGRCPRYLGLPVRLEAGADSGVERRLVAMGRTPINPLVDLANVVLFETGQPLHLFARDKVAGGILVRDAKKGERMMGLDGEEHALAPGDLLITSGGEPVALAGVLGGLESGADGGAGEYLLESATFDAGSVRQSAQRLGLATDSSYRFERGVDPAGWEVGARRFLWWCERLGWGGADGPAVLAGAAAPPRAAIPLPPGEAKRRLGLEIADEDAAAILERLGFGRGGGGWLAPSWRVDV